MMATSTQGTEKQYASIRFKEKVKTKLDLKKVAPAGKRAFMRFLLKTSGAYLADNHLKAIFATHFTEQSGYELILKKLKPASGYFITH